MNHDSLLEELKTIPAKIEFVSKYSFKKVMDAMSAWPSTFIDWTAPNENYPIELNKASIKWLWDGCFFDLKKMILLVGTNAADLVSKMKDGNMIYPDGTYNDEMCDLIKQLNQRKDK